ncbi:E3 SUMO-protein ligase NSE2-like [Colias croceus]|uniref:E3 SUMO-protein ligase NSE2-like n=1 Tax=Colias crocea TaxID=72248 RepID=UPI001E27DD14|nr:E3 SUMO-protein ligase NSE2-like [Colias croceus]
MADSDLSDLRKQCLNSLYLCSDNISKYLDEGRNNEYEKLKSIVKEYCLMEAQQDVAIQALEKTKKEIDATNVDTLENKFKANLSSMAGKRLDVNRHPYMLELNKHIEKGLENARNNLDDSDLAITETQDRLIDPITKKAIVNPVRNTNCGHIYEEEVIMKIIQKKKLRCPVAGCGNREPLIRQHLISDEELKFRLALTQHSTMIEERSVLDLDDTT